MKTHKMKRKLIVGAIVTLLFVFSGLSILFTNFGTIISAMGAQENQDSIRRTNDVASEPYVVSR